ncbi:hypothetical protein [Janthinobacterium sp. PC23-8]|uniref:hypothetical protein n=1 Tax=Janthinobacterium sp. PC23-8 TaxID=2012679 RepID=UPI000B9708E9|nr:hypothetical protein [Janthinobacterium sp. PC23-8]OYO30196.1 hypothetical protein CD932_02900 [Janthinobacterium sp. PC23-8]
MFAPVAVDEIADITSNTLTIADRLCEALSCRATMAWKWASTCRCTAQAEPDEIDLPGTYEDIAGSGRDDLRAGFVTNLLNGRCSIKCAQIQQFTQII